MIRLHILAALALFAVGALGVWERAWRWGVDRWRSRRDDLLDAHPVAVALSALEDVWGLDDGVRLSAGGRRWHGD